MPIHHNDSPPPSLRADDAEILHYGELLDGMGIALLVFSADAALCGHNAQATPLLADQPLVWLNEGGEPLNTGERLEIQVLRTANPLQGKIIGLAQLDGSTVWLKADALPVLADDGSVRRALVTLTDLSEQKTLQNALDKLSIRDPLTGVFNQRHVMHLLENEVHRARRYGTPFTLAQVDVDLFLPFCAEHGQPAGDLVLASIGKLLNDCMREIDIAGRIGNDEFLLVLPNVGLNDALIGLERLRNAIETKAFTSAGWRLTISGGITEYTGENSAALVERSRCLLIHAREAGRNRFCMDADIL